MAYRYPGVRANYTSDLLFSMEQLSSSPFRIARVDAAATLGWTVNNAENITGLPLETLQSEGRLFLSDYSDQKTLTLSEGKHAGGVSGLLLYRSSLRRFPPAPLSMRVRMDLV